MMIEICNFIIQNEELICELNLLKRGLLSPCKFNLLIGIFWTSLEMSSKVDNWSLIDRLNVKETSCILRHDETFKLLENIWFESTSQSLSLGNLVLVFDKFEMDDLSVRRDELCFEGDLFCMFMFP
jgi:hypothetical protein